MSFDLEKFQRSKAYDLMMGLPLIAWFVYVMIGLRPVLAYFAQAVLSDPTNVYFNLRFFAYFASACFALLNIILIVVRTSPVRRSRGLWPRAFAVAGTFLGVGINHLKPAEISPFWQSMAVILILIGSIGSVIAISKLGKSFSIMPEARNLVTSGPYAIARHPLYAAEMFSIAGTAILFQQPWAGLVGLGVLCLLFTRSVFEEQVLSEQYPEYVEYRKRVKRFGFV